MNSRYQEGESIGILLDIERHTLLCKNDNPKQTFPFSKIRQIYQSIFKTKAENVLFEHECTFILIDMTKDFLIESAFFFGLLRWQLATAGAVIRLTRTSTKAQRKRCPLLKSLYLNVKLVPQLLY